MPSDKALQSTSHAAKAVEYCNRIHHEEGLLKELSAEERYKKRLAKIKPLLDEFFACLEYLQVSSKSEPAGRCEVLLRCIRSSPRLRRMGWMWNGI